MTRGYRPITALRSAWAGRKPQWLIEYVSEGCEFSFGYGLAWRDWSSAGCYTAPMPLNVFIGWGRWIFAWVRFQAPGGATWLDDKLREAYNLGRAADRKPE